MSEQLGSSRWRDAWFHRDDTVYLNAAGQAPMPRVSLEAVQASLEWKKFPYLMTDGLERELPQRVRESLAHLIGASPQDIALTTGASAGLIALAYALHWKRGDEVQTARGEFPAQYTTWMPMKEREGVTLRVISPRERWVAAEDFIAAMTPQTRVISVSLVRFDDGSMLDAPKLGAACRANGTVLALDVSQCCGAIPLDVTKLGADFITCSGYKWLLGPYGTGFLWASPELVSRFRPGPFYWQRIAGLAHYGNLILENPQPSEGAQSLDTSETASYFNFAGWDASLTFLRKVGVATVADHNWRLMAQLFDGLPKDRCIQTSPSTREQVGPYGCFMGRTANDTNAMYDRITSARLMASLREGNIRVSTHLYNSPEDIEKVIRAVAQ